MITSEWFENPDRILTAFGVLLAAVSVLYFGGKAILEISPLIKSFLLVSASAVFVLASFYVEEKGSKILAYIFATVSYVTFIIQYINSLEPSSEIVFLLLGLSGAIFIFAGRKIGEKEYKKSFVVKAIAVITIIALGAVAIDSTASEPSQTINFHQSVEIGAEPVEIGEVKLTNSYILPQQYEINDFEACGDQREFRVNLVDYSESDGVISGLSSKNVEYEMSRALRHPENTSSKQFSLNVVDECGENINGTVQIRQRESNR